MSQFFGLFLLIILINFIFFIKIDYISNKLQIFDRPSKIKNHKKIVPPIGGVLLFINIIITLFYISFLNFNILETFFYIYGYKQLIVFGLTLTIIFFTGLYDDKYNLSANQKLFALIPSIFFLIYIDDGLQISMISISIYDFQINLNKSASIFSLICFLTYLNCINMFDGINLQTSIFSITIILLIQFYVGSYSPILIVILIFFIIFSIFNFQSKVFIGDSGTLIVGFIIGYILIKLHNYEQIHSDVIFSFTIIPFLDMFRLIIKRLITGKHPFNGDTNHIHHRLIKKTNYYNAILIIFITFFIPILINIIFGFKYNFILIILSILVYFFLLLTTSDKKNNTQN